MTDQPTTARGRKAKASDSAPTPTRFVRLFTGRGQPILISPDYVVQATQTGTRVSLSRGAHFDVYGEINEVAAALAGAAEAPKPEIDETKALELRQEAMLAPVKGKTPAPDILAARKRKADSLTKRVANAKGSGE